MEFLDIIIVKKSILKIAAVLLILNLNWAGLSAVLNTAAYFNDTETSSENTYSAGTLDFSLVSSGDYSLNFKFNETAVRNINVINNGSLLFKYIVEGADFSGPLCEKIGLEAKLDGETKYNSGLANFILDPPVDFSGPDDGWEFVFSFSGDVETYKNTSCQFYLDFKGWQNDLEIYPEGFNDIEREFTILTLRAEKTIVLNEFLPNPICNECGREGITGEWVEIYNNSDESVDLAGWYIQDAGPNNTVYITTSNTFHNSTVIGPKGSGYEWLVVFLNDCILDNDNGDTVNLYDNNSNLIDSYSYSGSAPQGKSYARYPDGIGPWYDPIPTPGGPNMLGFFNIFDITKPILPELPGINLPKIEFPEIKVPDIDIEVIVIQEEPELEQPVFQEAVVEEQPAVESGEILRETGSPADSSFPAENYVEPEI